MESIQHFFRANEDGFVFKMFSPVHIGILAVYIIGIITISKGDCGLKDEKKNRNFLKTMAIILLVDQIVLYIWQFASGYFKLEVSLPLYHCRVSVWFLIIGVLFDDSLLKTLGIYWGSVGSIVAMILVDLYDFSFPHYTNFQFFIVHILMGWIIADMLFVQGFTPSKDDDKKTIIFTNLYNIFLIAFNVIMNKKYKNVNYGYMLHMPGNKNVEASNLHPLFMMVIFNIAMLLFASISNKHRKRKLNESKA